LESLIEKNECWKQGKKKWSVSCSSSCNSRQKEKSSDIIHSPTNP